MKIWSVIIVIICIESCSVTRDDKSMEDKIIGQWCIDSCSIYFVHAHSRGRLSDVFNLPQNRIKTNFLINFKQDKVFSLYHDNGPIKIGKYLVSDSLLTLTLDGDSINWIVFSVDSINNHQHRYSTFVMSNPDKTDL